MSSPPSYPVSASTAPRVWQRSDPLDYAYHASFLYWARWGLNCSLLFGRARKEGSRQGILCWNLRPAPLVASGHKQAVCCGVAVSPASLISSRMPMICCAHCRSLQHTRLSRNTIHDIMICLNLYGLWEWVMKGLILTTDDNERLLILVYSSTSPHLLRACSSPARRRGS